MIFMHGNKTKKGVEIMKTLVIYDITGHIIQQNSGNVYKPQGIPFLEIEIPEGKILKSINTTKEPHEPVYRDITEINPDICTMEELKVYLIAKSKENLENYLATHPVTSKCHGGKEKQYSITKDKQVLLANMILMCQAAAQSGTEYQPSWNAAGEPCSYDWTVQELLQLAFEAEAVVRPLISHQQTIEAEINTASTKEDALAISVEFGESL